MYFWVSAAASSSRAAAVFCIASLVCTAPPGSCSQPSSPDCEDISHYLLWTLGLAMCCPQAWMPSAPPFLGLSFFKTCPTMFLLQEASLTSEAGSGPLLLASCMPRGVWPSSVTMRLNCVPSPLWSRAGLSAHRRSWMKAWWRDGCREGQMGLWAWLQPP